MSRVTSTDGDYFEITLHHRASRRRFSVRLSAEEFAYALTGMGGIYGRFEETVYPRVRKDS